MSRDPKATAFESPYVSMQNNPILFNDMKGDTVKVSYRTGFLGLGGRKELKYENGNLFKKDGTLYTEKLKGYVGNVKSALDEINSVTPGSNMLREMETSSEVFKIRSGKNEFVPTRKAYAGMLLVLPNSSVFGSGGVIFWNPNITESGPNQRGNKERPPFIGLTHEFGHALMSKRGTLNSNSFSPNAPDVALRKINYDDFNAMHLENQIRSSFGLPLREFYTLDSSGNGFMRALNQNTNTSSTNSGYDYSINNPIQINYNGQFSGR